MSIVGIDLGTTNSLISYWTEEGVVIIPNALGSNLTPSVVSVDDNGEIIIGQIAKERLITHPSSTIATFKRYMGTKKYLEIGKFKFLPEELSSFVIRALKQDAEAYLGEDIEEAVISVPAYFNDAQRKATQRAGELAGLKVERIISEPTAAAVAYGFHESESEAKLMVLDLGGGTFDVSILDLFENVMEVQAVAGNNFLGGEDFTDILAAMFIHKHGIGMEDINKKAYGIIRKKAEICKRSLSSNKTAEMNCVLNEKSYTFKVGREEFEEAAQDLISKLRQPIERAMRDACIEPDEIDSIILVGGATRMTLISSFISKLFGRIPNSVINPDEAVVIGAGIQAAMKERNAALKEVVLTDVCPYTLGVETSIRNNFGEPEAGHFLPIIERNTVIPVSKMKRLFTMHDNQKIIRLAIYQGESRLIKDNIKLGELEIDIPRGKAGEQAIDVRYTYDINGILEVEVTAIETGIKNRMVIEQNPGFMSQEEIEKRLKTLENIKIHPRDRQENKLLISRGERLYEELLGIDRMRVGQALQEFENVLNEQDDKAAKKAAVIFKMKLDEIEMYKEF